MEPLKGGQLLRQQRHSLQIAAADGDLPPQLRVLPELLGCLVRQLHQLLGPAAQQHPLVGQDDVVAAALEELHPQFLFQLHQLPGEGRLGQVEQSRRLGDILLPGDRQKVS